jgi:hypothetical protein
LRAHVADQLAVNGFLAVTVQPNGDHQIRQRVTPTSPAWQPEMYVHSIIGIIAGAGRISLCRTNGAESKQSSAERSAETVRPPVESDGLALLWQIWERPSERETHRKVVPQAGDTPIGLPFNTDHLLSS